MKREGIQPGKIMDLVYLKQEHEEQGRRLGRQRHELLSQLRIHQAEAIKLQKKIEELIIKKEV